MLYVHVYIHVVAWLKEVTSSVSCPVAQIELEAGPSVGGHMSHAGPDECHSLSHTCL